MLATSLDMISYSVLTQKHRLVISDPSKKESYRYLRNLQSRQKYA